MPQQEKPLQVTRILSTTTSPTVFVAFHHTVLFYSWVTLTLEQVSVDTTMYPKIMVTASQIPVKQKTCALQQPEYLKWSWPHPNDNEVQLDHVIFRTKRIKSLQSYCCYNTVELDSDHRILTVTVKFSFSATKKT